LIDGRRTESSLLADRLMLSLGEAAFVNRLADAWEIAELLAPTATFDSIRNVLLDEGVSRKRAVGLPPDVALRLGCALALVHDPPFVLIDEPFHHLTSEQRSSMVHWVCQLARRRLVMVTTRSDVPGWDATVLSVDRRQRLGISKNCIREASSRSLGDPV